MSDRAPSWLAGYRAATTPMPAAITFVHEPPGMDQYQRLDFVTGFLVGAHDMRRADLVDALRAAP